MASPRWAARTEAYRLHLETLGRSPHTIETTLSALGNFARFCRENRRCPCPELAAPWLASLYGLYARWTVRGYYFALRSFLRWEGAGNPLAEIPVPHERDVPIRPYSHLELRRLLRAAEGRRNHTLLLLLLATGMRANELVCLEVGDVDWETGSLLIRNGKGGKNRRVAPGQRALDALHAYLSAGRIRRGWLFPGLNGGHLRADSLYHLVERLGARAGIPGANCHRFRHTFSHEFLAAGAGDVGDLKELLGHSTIAMSLRYARYFAADRALDAQRRFNDRLTRAV